MLWWVDGGGRRRRRIGRERLERRIRFERSERELVFMSWKIGSAIYSTARARHFSSSPFLFCLIALTIKIKLFHSNI